MNIIEEGPDFETPIALLQAISEKLLKREFPPTKSRMDMLYRHLKASVTELVEAGLDQIGEAFELLSETGLEAELPGHLIEEFEAGRDLAESTLVRMSQTFFASTTFQDLETQEADLLVLEGQLSDALERMENALTRACAADSPKQHQTESPDVEEALESIDFAMESLTLHLEQGDTEALKSALLNLRRAGDWVERAMISAA